MDILFQCAKKPLINLLGKKSELTIFNNGQITLIKERIPFKKWPTLFAKRTEQTMFCKDIRFVTDVSNFFNTHIVKRHKLYFGHKVQMHAPYLSKSEVDEFKKAIKKLGADLDANGTDAICWSLLSPISWIAKKERITFGDNSIVYRNKKETTKILFDEIAYVWIDSTWYSNFIIGKQIAFLGEQNICPNYKTHIKGLNEIINNKIKKPLAIGHQCKSNFIWKIFHPFTYNPNIKILSDGIALIDSKGIRKLKYSEIDSYEIHRKHFYSWCGDIIITGIINNIREDQSNNMIAIIQRGVGRFAWSDLKNILKTKANK